MIVGSFGVSYRVAGNISQFQAFREQGAGRRKLLCAWIINGRKNIASGKNEKRLGEEGVNVSNRL